MNQNKKNQKAEVQKKAGEKMNYEEFTGEIKTRIQQHAGTEVDLKVMKRNNGVSRKGILIHGKKKDIAPVICLEPYYARYLEGVGMDEIAGEVYTACLNNRHSADLVASLFLDYEKVKEKVLFKLVNYKLNEKLLQEVPHQKYLDLAAVCYCPLDKDEIPGTASVLVRKEHLAFWGITEEELLERAFQNTPRLLEHQLLDMEDVIRDFLMDGEGGEFPESKDKAPEMLILTNRNRINGAACLLYPNLLEQLAEKEKSNFVILPSSVHEVILVPVTDSMGKDEISAYTQMVQEVNQTELAEEEILSDHAYFYDRSKAECTGWPADISAAV